MKFAFSKIAPPSRSFSIKSSVSSLPCHAFLRSYLLAPAFLVLIFLFPQASAAGAKSGLLLWFESVLPALLPCLILSGLCIRLGIIKYLAIGLAPIGKILFGLSPYGCYPAFLGFLAGLPTGASAAADLAVEGKIEKAEAEYLITFCNNVSPMFLINYAAAGSLKLPGFGLPLCIIVWMSSIISAWGIRLLRGEQGVYKSPAPLKSMHSQTDKVHTVRSLTDLTDEAILNAFTILTKTGGYIILFSILSQITTVILGSGVFSCLLSGLLETTTGIQNAAALSEGLLTTHKSAEGLLLAGNTKVFAVSAICGFGAFGGLSGLAQTKSVTRKAGLSLKWYIASRVLSSLLASGAGVWYCLKFLS